MKKLILVLAALAIFGASPTIYQPTEGTGLVQIKPQAVPTSTTVVAASDAWIQGITIINTSAGALTVTVASRETSPVSLLEAVSIAANTTYVVSVPYGHWMPQGFTITSSGSGLNYYAKWRQ